MSIYLDPRGFAQIMSHAQCMAHGCGVSPTTFAVWADLMERLNPAPPDLPAERYFFCAGHEEEARELASRLGSMLSAAERALHKWPADDASSSAWPGCG